MSVVLSCIVSHSYHICRNAPDFGSRAKTPSAPIVSQFWSIPFSYGLICLFGVIVSSSSQTIYGEAIWSPVDLLGKFLDENPTPATRFGVSLNDARLFCIDEKVIVGLVHRLLFYYSSGRHHTDFLKALMLIYLR
jgi:NCS1 family nucleobase:cation symporter-1